MKLLKYTQYIYIIASVFFLLKAIKIWSTDRSQAYLLLFLGVLGLFVFFFRRHFQKKFEERNNPK